jgi:hypothetical protein
VNGWFGCRFLVGFGRQGFLKLGARRASFGLCSRFCNRGLGAPQHHKFSDYLDHRSAQRLRHGSGQMRSVMLAVSTHPHFDQTVGVQRPIDFGQHGLGQAAVAKHDDRIKVMGLGFQGFTLGLGQGQGARQGIEGCRRFDAHRSKVTEP